MVIDFQGERVGVVRGESAVEDLSGTVLDLCQADWEMQVIPILLMSIDFHGGDDECLVRVNPHCC